jgi:hypothetical protein
MNYARNLYLTSFPFRIPLERGNTNPKGLAQVVEALVLRFAPFKVQGSTPHECKQSLGATLPGEKLVI